MMGGGGMGGGGMMGGGRMGGGRMGGMGPGERLQLWRSYVARQRVAKCKRCHVTLQDTKVRPLFLQAQACC